MVKLLNRRGILCLHDLVTGVWSAEERGSTFMCRWMLDLFQPLLQILRRYGSGRGHEAQQSRTLILCGAIFNQQTAFDEAVSPLKKTWFQPTYPEITYVFFVSFGC